MAVKNIELLGVPTKDLQRVIDTQKDLGMEPPGCLAKAEFMEPIFVLRAQDRLAPAVVRDWVRRARAEGSCPESKLLEAMDIAADMERWHTRKFPD